MARGFEHLNIAKQNKELYHGTFQVINHSRDGHVERGTRNQVRDSDSKSRIKSRKKYNLYKLAFLIPVKR